MNARVLELDRASVPALRFLRPSLLDVVYIGILCWLILFTIAGNGMGLLIDVSTGVHIRTGEYIQAHGVPHTDFFSWTRAGERWFAWEWLTDVIFAGLFHAGGLGLITVFTAGVIALSLVVVFAHTAARGANVFIAVLLLHFAVSNSSVHYLARPHILTLLFFAISFLIIDSDLRRPSRRLWWLMPLTALWANLHGGFAGLFATLALIAAGSALERNFAAAVRYAGALAGCLFASLVNPYGFEEHLHLIRYLSAGWLRAVVLEFQQPRFDGPGGLYFEALFAIAAWLAVRLALERKFAAALLVAFWGHAALQSVRHVPILTILVLPLLAGELGRLWRWLLDKAAIMRTLDNIAQDYHFSLRRISIWPLAVTLLLCSPLVSLPIPEDFSDPRYPVEMVRRHADLLSTGRLFAPDTWGDYLLFHGYPKQRVFIDGRSDFYGEKLSHDYMDILFAHHSCPELLERYRVESALIPADSALATLLGENTRWRRIDGDNTAVMFVKLR